VAPAQKEKASKQEKPRQKRERPRILTFKEKKELEALPVLIESLEAERARLFEILADPDFYRNDGSRVVETRTRIEEIEKEIAQTYERWELLESIPSL
jgi:ATP-binding cassette subfamily F protein uup